MTQSTECPECGSTNYLIRKFPCDDGPNIWHLNESKSIPLAELWSGIVVSREIIGAVGVDSGTIMIIDPGYVLEDDRENESVYLEATTFVGEKDANNKQKFHQTWRDGVVALTLMGDGGYPVIAEKNKHGAIVRLIIDFGSEGIEPLLEEEDEDLDEAQTSV